MSMIAKLQEGKKLEYGIFVLFLALYCLVSAFHEPWFDEAQAWQIARCLSLRELLFTIPHYEGHPPLWYLILLLPAKLGAPFELGLKTVGLLLSAASAGLLLFRSRLPRVARLLLPFSFFFFYQYGVIVRPYGLMLLLMLLMGQTFPRRNERPWRFTLLMMLLCLTSAYGIVISGGIALGMVWELFREKGPGGLFRELFRDQRTLSLLALLLLAILLVLELLPREDTWVTSADGENSLLLCLLCTLFTFLGDCLLTDSIWFRTDTVLLQNASIPLPSLLSCVFFGLLLWLLIAAAASKRNLKFFVLPYVFFAGFSAAVYVSAHHVGIALIILLFWLEADARDGDRFEIGRALLVRLSKTERDRKLLKHMAGALALACLLVPVYWTGSAAVRELRLEYSYGRSASAFLQENHLDERLILSSFGENSSEDYGEKLGHEDYLNTYENAIPVLICAYLEHNVFLNLGDGRDEEAYMHYRMADYEKSLADMEAWRQKGIPEVLIGNPKLEAMYGDEISINDYSVVFAPEMNYIWKNRERYGIVPIFLRNDLLEECGLEPLTDPKYAFLGGLRITEQMKEDYAGGVPVEDILKPYLDALFGEEG